MIAFHEEIDRTKCFVKEAGDCHGHEVTKGETVRKELCVSGTFPNDYSQENKAGVVLSRRYHDRNSFTLSKETCGHSVDWKITHCC